jgi:hypothetical protein
MSRSKIELEQGAQWVHYELHTLLYSLRVNEHALRSQSSESEGEQQFWNTVNTCTLEAFLLHYRNLISFLNNGKYKDDVKANDYADSWQGNGTDQDEDIRLNKLLAHISYSRGALGSGQWNTAEMRNRICDSFGQFLRSVNPEHSHLFKRCMTELENRIVTRDSGTNSATTMSTWRLS